MSELQSKTGRQRSKRAPSRGAQLSIIYWRDIPSQVQVKQGRERHSVALADRFIKAIDSAAMFAGKTDSAAYMEDWRKETRPCDGDMVAVAEATVKELEASFSKEALRLLIKAKGIAANVEQVAG